MLGADFLPSSALPTRKATPMPVTPRSYLSPCSAPSSLCADVSVSSSPEPFQPHRGSEIHTVLPETEESETPCFSEALALSPQTSAAWHSSQFPLCLRPRSLCTLGVTLCPASLRTLPTCPSSSSCFFPLCFLPPAWRRLVSHCVLCLEVLWPFSQPGYLEPVHPCLSWKGTLFCPC